jgi:hypothetical protein
MARSKSRRRSTIGGAPKQASIEYLEERTLLATVNWMNPSGGDWNTPGNWDANRVPDSGDDAVISITGITVTHSANVTDSIKSLNSQATVTLSGGTLNVSGTVHSDVPMNIFGFATLGTATIDTTTTLRASGGTLSGVTLNGTLDLATLVGSVVVVENGLTLGGTVNLGEADGTTDGRLILRGTQTLGGTGTIIFGGNQGNQVISQGTNAVFTIGSGITLRGKSGLVGGQSSSETVINHGTISADVAGGTINVDAAGLTTDGTMQALNGGILQLNPFKLAGTWVNTGQLIVNNSTLALGGVFHSSDLGNFSRTGGSVNLIGTLDNSNSTLALNSTTGTWNLHGGKIQGGIIAVPTDGAQLTVDSFGSTLKGVTLNANLDLTASLKVVDGLTLNSTIAIGKADGTGSATLNFEGTQTLAGTGAIVFGGSTSNALNIQGFPNVATLTIGPNITIRGKSGTIRNSGTANTFINQGKIDADVAGGTITLDAPGWINQGTAQALGGGTLSLKGSWNNAGVIRETDSTLNLGGTFRFADLGNFSRTGGTVNVIGTITNTNTTLTLNNATGSWNLSNGGMIDGGIIAATDGAQLIASGGLGGTLNNVTVNMDVTTAFASNLTVIGGMTLNGTIRVGQLDGTSSGSITFQGTQTLAGTGTILMNESGADHCIGSHRARQECDFFGIFLRSPDQSRNDKCRRCGRHFQYLRCGLEQSRNCASAEWRSRCGRLA